MVLAWEHGFWFRIHIFYTYILLLTGTIQLIVRLSKNQAKYRGQSALIIIDIAVPWFFNALYLTGLSFGPILDPTPVGFIFLGLLFALNMRLFRFFVLISLAKHSIFHNLSEAIFVLDLHDVIIDMNQAARELFEKIGSSLVG